MSPRGTSPLLSTNVSCTWKNPEDAKGYRTGVSLHSHTKHSKEKLQFIPAFTEKWPFLQRILDRQYRKSVVPVDLRRAYWTSPLTPRQAFDVERNQIENQLGLASLVSLTDHDSIHAPSLLRLATETAEVPLSLEWSVPICGTIFHLGVHNLPGDQAEEITAEPINIPNGAPIFPLQSFWQRCTRYQKCWLYSTIRCGTCAASAHSVMPSACINLCKRTVLFYMHWNTTGCESGMKTGKCDLLQSAGNSLSFLVETVMRMSQAPRSI